jgi:hypothetical protein
VKIIFARILLCTGICVILSGCSTFQRESRVSTPITVAERNGVFFAVLGKPADFDVELSSEGGTPKLIRVTHPVENRPDLFLLTYHAGYAGTSQVYKITRGALVDLQKRKVLIDALLKYESQNGAPGLIQPKWNFSEHSLKIIDVDVAKNQDVNY